MSAVTRVVDEDAVVDVAVADQVVDRAAAATSLDVIVANLNGSFVCKLYDRKSQVLLSPGLDHQPYALGEGDIFEIEGIVVRSVRMHRYVRWLSQCMR